MGSSGINGTFLRRFRRACTVLVPVLLLCAGTNAQGQSYQAGLAAVDDGDMEQAVRIWQDLIDSDAVDRSSAEYALALLYETGRALPWDEARAAELYAASGLPQALTNLGLMYAEGRGVGFDPAKAAELWQQAADVGHSFAQFNLGLAYYGGNGVPKSAVRALELIYEAGEGGLPEAQWAVCQFYERGVGVPVDLDEAMAWCALAAEQGQLQAVDAVQRLSAQKRTPEQQVPAAKPVDIGEDDPDNVDLSAEVPPTLVDSDPANEFLTQAPAATESRAPVQAQTQQQQSRQAQTQAQQAEAPTAPPAPVEANTPIGPEEAASSATRDALILLGSEFDEFADLLSPPDPAKAVEDFSSGGVDQLLSDDSDAIAALIESAGPVQPNLPDLQIDEQERAGENLLASTEPQRSSLSLQEMVDGTRVPAPDALPPLPINRPNLTYAIPPIVDGPVFAVWLGTGKDADEARGIYDRVMQVAPDVLGLMEVAYQNDTLTREETGFPRDTSVVRLLFGPLPGQAYAWQICNLLKMKQGSTFCYPVEVED